MTDALKKQMFYAGGTLAGFAVARGLESKDIVPFTVVGGLLGFALAESFIGPERTPKTRALNGVRTAKTKSRRH